MARPCDILGCEEPAYGRVLYELFVGKKKRKITADSKIRVCRDHSDTEELFHWLIQEESWRVFVFGFKLSDAGEDTATQVRVDPLT